MITLQKIKQYIASSSQHRNHSQTNEEQYNILHGLSYKKISVGEMRKMVKQQYENKKTVIMLYLFWLRLYNIDIVCIHEILKQYNISIEEYTKFEQERCRKIQERVSYYISNKTMSNGLVSSDIFDELKQRPDFNEFISKNKNEVDTLIHRVSKYNKDNESIIQYALKCINNLNNYKNNKNTETI